MNEASKLHIHLGGADRVKTIAIEEIVTVELIAKRVGGDPHFQGCSVEELFFFEEDSEEELPRHHRFEPGHHHKHVHCHKCKHIEVKVIFNGETKQHKCRPGFTLRKVLRWTEDEFKVDKSQTMVLRLRNTGSEPLDLDSHVGSYAMHPPCEATFYLTPLCPIQG